jgi:hypothetical protein
MLVWSSWQCWAGLLWEQQAHQNGTRLCRDVHCQLNALREMRPPFGSKTGSIVAQQYDKQHAYGNTDSRGSRMLQLNSHKACSKGLAFAGAMSS